MSTARLRGGQARQDQLLSITLDVLRETGYDRLTIDEVVARAHASKTTVYRRWPSKSALVVAAFVNAVSDLPAGRDTGSLRGDLLAFFHDLIAEMERLADVMAGLVGELRRNTELAAAMREGYIYARRQAVIDAFVRARDRGEIAKSADVDMLWQIAPAVIFFRWLLTGEPVGREEAHRLVTEVVLPLALAGTDGDADRHSGPGTGP
ncbi:TetR/AcrR family transcriptional regulator [Streptomyces litchfieldiae]|uniref:TetR/AcrR family transcriptional regulator n=1 Tax=Streptomyces litchfieldiae TaxID=3075543 RepID=A0ABU2MZ51_9ACTN|nr:TetR/AcrR family transcriptional regulator [Streptomyces sp. DSM 44938]MDT0346925.1 TetR/AcrR family transcriptional regulator [Streptomyces sp. DSM 44938]